jgi:EAL domain-containing protein (putative c-di-GMP-specific phosphodiesterase class I)
MRGYKFGDAILRDFEKKIRNYFNSEIIYNPYCDQFIVITRDTKKNIELKLEQLVDKDKLNYQGFNYSASVGLIDHPLDYENSEELLLASEKALTIAKEKYFSSRKYCDYHKKTLEDQVYSFFSHQRIDPDEFYMCYQSIQSINDEIIGYEALLRWENKALGLVNPSVFIPIAEKLGCITQITEMVFEKVLRDIYEKKILFSSKFITINISVDDLVSPRFNQKLESMKKMYPELIKKIIFEITESLEFEKMTTFNQIMKNIHDFGIRVFIDDFGTGFSSLDRIMNASIDGIKIDKSFTKNILENENHKTILQAMLCMANKSNIAIVIEGVETKEEYEYLRNLDACLLQGYYFSKPMQLSAMAKSEIIGTHIV